MKQTVTLYDFIEAFRKMERVENFSSEALVILFDYLNDIGDSQGKEVELDVIAICCDFSEMTFDEILEYYDIDIDHLESDDEDGIHMAIEEFINENTTYIGATDEGLIFADF